MQSGTGRRALATPGAGVLARGLGKVAGLVFGLAVAGCSTQGGGPALMQVALRSPSIAFESIDGPPAPVFERLVSELAAQAAKHQVIVVSRTSPAVFRVRCYLAAAVINGRTHYDWVWDVYDAESHRALRIGGEEPGDIATGDAWASLDDATLSRIARASMDQLVSFFGAPGLGTSQDPLRGAFAEEPGTPARLQAGRRLVVGFDPLRPRPAERAH
jgi:hypothetical protein